MISSDHRLTAFAGGWEAHRHRHCIWVVSPPDFPFSRAFDEVALALSEAFSELGGSAPVVHHPSEWNGRLPIILGCNLLNRIGNPPLPEGSIIYNLEQILPGVVWLTERYIHLLKNFPVLDFSPLNLSRLQTIGVPHARLLEVGYSPGLTRIPRSVEEDADVFFYGAGNDRRERVLHALVEAGLRVFTTSQNTFGPARDEWIGRSKLVLNLHYYDQSTFEIVRVSYLLANRVPVVSEGSVEQPDRSWAAGGVEFAPYHELADRCVALVRDPQRRKELAERGFQLFAARRQSVLLQKCIRSACAPPDHSASRHSPNFTV
jgi:hypothetical protein